MIITTISIVVIHELHGGGTSWKEIPRGPGGSWKVCRSRDNCVVVERVGGETAVECSDGLIPIGAIRSATGGPDRINPSAD